jgi:hypothetical protein
MLQKLNKVMSMKGVPNPNFKGFICNNIQTIGMLFKSCMVVGKVMNPRSIRNECVISIGLNLWTNTKNNKSIHKCNNNTRPCVMNIRMPPCWKRQMLVMQLFILGGIP